MDAVFIVRGDLLRLRRTVIPMRELIFRVHPFLGEQKSVVLRKGSRFFIKVKIIV